MLVQISALAVLVVFTRVSATEEPHKLNSRDVPQARISKGMRSNAPDIIHFEEIPMGPRMRIEQKDAIASVYGPAFLREEWIWNREDSQNIKYNSGRGDGQRQVYYYQSDRNRDINYKDGSGLERYIQEGNRYQNEIYNYGRQQNQDNILDYGRVQGEGYNGKLDQIDVYKYGLNQNQGDANGREQNQENKYSARDENQDEGKINNNERHDDHKPNRKPIFPVLAKLKTGAKRLLEGPISIVRNLLPQLKNVEEKEIRPLEGLSEGIVVIGQRVKEGIKGRREQIRYGNIQQNNQQPVIETVGNRLYPGYDDPATWDRTLQGRENDGGYGKETNDKEKIPQSWANGYQPAQARLPEVSDEERYHGIGRNKEENYSQLN